MSEQMRQETQDEPGCNHSLLTRRLILVTASLCFNVCARSEELTKITIGLSSSSLPAAGARIAKQLGLFEKHGIDATIKPLDNASIATMALISGSTNFSTSSGVDVVVARSRGQDIVAVSSIVNGLTAVLTLAKSTVARVGVAPTAPIVERLKALNGVAIASPSPTSPFTLSLKSAAEAVGARVRFVFMDQPAMFPALKAGAVEGFLSASPYYAGPLVDGSGMLWLNGPKGEFPPQLTPANAVTLNALRSFADDHPDLIRRVQAVFAELSEIAKTRPVEMKAAISILFPSIDARTLDVLYDTDLAGFRAKPLEISDMAREIAFVRASGIPAPNLDRLDPSSMVLQGK